VNIYPFIAAEKARRRNVTRARDLAAELAQTR
jgi:hypothetical protein